MKTYYADAANTSIIDGPYFVPGPVALPNGREFYARAAVPEWDLYEAIEDLSPNPPYEVLIDTATAFEGVVRDPAARVRETRIFQRISIDQLLETKREELLDFTDAVYFSSFEMEGAGQVLFWVNASLRSRLYRADVNGYYQWTPPDEPAPLNLIVADTRAAVVSDSGRPWRDVPVWIVRQSNLNKTRAKVDQAEWEALAEASGRFGIDVAYASDDVESSLELEHANGDWDALAAIDVTADPNATNPWPAHSLDAFNGAAF